MAVLTEVVMYRARPGAPAKTVVTVSDATGPVITGRYGIDTVPPPAPRAAACPIAMASSRRSS
ncbi:hypothetical protein [Inquilinus limosus]|uniref:Uncharacterized protein n=1 Tax=Inquilinus limosus MP06 TaxID=1398085 RepID=A0A0A0DAG1_9PROT|nr:hypothetical protein [Inquilinus limosus]KGM35025.1 hypothetical protein P409_06850 [Inquilinus limosus MP06]